MSPEAGDRARELARHYLQVDRPQQALDALGHGTADLEDPELWALRGWALVDLDRDEEAAEVASGALARWPADVDLLRLLAVAQARRDHLAEAEQAVLAALRAEPDDSHLLCTYADTLMRGGQLEKAAGVLELAERADADDVLVVRMRLNLAHLRGDDARARALAEDLLRRDADDYQGHVMLGGMDLERLRLRSAEQRLATAIGRDPSRTGAVAAARSARVLRSPLAWPLLPFERFGPGLPWVAAITLVFGLGAAGLDGAATVVAVVWIALCAYSWTVGSLLHRRARAGRS